jgi:ABC-type Fe3+-hydroxamate transport system substrate-binding protein
MPKNTSDVTDKSDREKKREEKARKRKERWNHRIERVKAATAKALAVATKRKWLVFLIGIGLLAYFTISTGSFSGILQTVKGLFGG